MYFIFSYLLICCGYRWKTDRHRRIDFLVDHIKSNYIAICVFVFLSLRNVFSMTLCRLAISVRADWTGFGAFNKWMVFVVRYIYWWKLYYVYLCVRVCNVASCSNVNKIIQRTLAQNTRWLFARGIAIRIWAYWRTECRLCLLFVPFSLCG